MSPIERVSAALNHCEPDRLPKGEIVVSQGFAEKLTGCTGMSEFDLIRKALEILEADLVTVSADQGFPPYRSPEESYPRIRRWNEETDYYIFALVGGPFSGAAGKSGLMEYCRLTLSQPSKARELARNAAEENAEIAQRCIGHGAYGVIIADDIAYNERTLLSPRMLRDLIFPLLREEAEMIRDMNVPVIYHSDGNLNAVLDDLAAIGFDGIQGLQPSAHMEILDLKRKYGHFLTLMGNFEVDSLFAGGNRAEKERSIARTIRACNSNGGYILSSCAGFHDGTPVENALALYEIARSPGVDEFE